MKYLTVPLLAFLLLATPARADVRDRFLDAINERRPCAALAPTGHRLLNDARDHSRLMANRGFIFHTKDLSDPRFDVIGEVVGVSDHWRYIFEALFNSPPHRRILRDCQYDIMALGLYRPGDGTVWLTGRLYG